MKIATLAFAGSERTMGLEIVTRAVRRAFPGVEYAPANVEFNIAKEADYLFVSLYWWRDCYSLVRYLADAGIDPRRSKPRIIIGGMSALNPRPLVGYFHYAVLGDGEDVIVPLIEAIEAGADTSGIAGVWRADGDVVLRHAKSLPTEMYVDIRTNKTARIEISRGCKTRCPFCQLAYVKPYRELPLEVIRHLVLTSPTKSIALFAPDRSGHSKIVEIEEIVRKAGKNDTGSDVRLDSIKKHKRLGRVRFGVEGFSEKTRRGFRKVPTNAQMIDRMLYLANEAQSRTGKPISTATMYMIADLPGEGRHALQEFWGTLREIDQGLKRRFTLFLSVAAFTPSPFTPMERCRVNPYSKFNAEFKRTRPVYENLVLATRGGLVGPAQRIAQMLVIRGDERAARAVHWLAVKGKKHYLSTKPESGRVLERAIAQTGFPVKRLYEQLPDDYDLPWANISLPDA